MTNGSPSCSESQASTIEVVTASVTIFGRFVYNLIKCGENIISKLYFCYCCCSRNCCSYGKTSYSLLTKWSVENSIFPVLLLQTNCAPEYSSKCNIFTKHN